MQKNVVQERGNAERKENIEERGHAGTQRSTGTRAHLCNFILFFTATSIFCVPFLKPMAQNSNHLLLFCLQNSIYPYQSG